MTNGQSTYKQSAYNLSFFVFLQNHVCYVLAELPRANKYMRLLQRTVTRGARRRQEAPGSARGRQEAPGGARGRQEAPGGAKRRQEAPRGARGRQEALGGARRRPGAARSRQEAPGAARRRQEAPRGARGRLGPPGGARRHGMPHTKVAFLNIPLSYLHISRGVWKLIFHSLITPPQISEKTRFLQNPF